MNTLSVKFSHQLSKLNLDLLPIIPLKILYFLVSRLWAEVEQRIQLILKVKMELQSDPSTRNIG